MKKTIASSAALAVAGLLMTGALKAQDVVNDLLPNYRTGLNSRRSLLT